MPADRFIVKITVADMAADKADAVAASAYSDFFAIEPFMAAAAAFSLNFINRINVPDIAAALAANLAFVIFASVPDTAFVIADNACV